MTPLPPVVCIVGPTAVGKTEFALEVARRLGGEIVSADSMQVYRGMDIGTAKPAQAERAEVRHHLIDVVEPDSPFSVADWVGLAAKAVRSIRTAGKIPVVSGGTPLYFEALFGRFGLAGGAPPVPELRESLRRQRCVYGQDYLHLLLEAVDPLAACRIHPADTKRTVRALEVYLSTGKPLSYLEREAGPAMGKVPGETVFYGLCRPREELRDRIEARVQRMFEAGLVAEVEGLLRKGLDPRLPAFQGVGYKEVVDYIEGRRSLAGTMALVSRNTRRLAKRQMTWFGSEPCIRWLRAGMNRTASLEDIVTRAGGKT